MLVQVEGRQNFRDLREGDDLKQSLINKHFVPTDDWGQEVQPITYEAKNGNLEGLCLAKVGVASVSLI